MANAHAKHLNVFRVLRKKKNQAHVKARVLSVFLLLLLNAVSLLCSVLFGKTKIFCLKIPPPKHQINIKNSKTDCTKTELISQKYNRLHQLHRKNKVCTKSDTHFNGHYKLILNYTPTSSPHSKALTRESTFN